jgi:radical SAM protein (TIGR01212 family)
MNSQAPYPWGTNRRFNSYSDWFTSLFGKRIQKLSINAGFTCPNRDGTIGYGGCTYCSNEAFIPAYCTPDRSVTQQIEQGIEFHRRRYRRADSYLAYFQAYTNTYAGTGRLKTLYDEALGYPGVLGLVIGTRPDCVNDELLDRLAEMSRDYFIIIEYGIESVRDDTLRRIHRGHDFATAVKALQATSDRGIHTGAHLIFGLPGESRDQIIDSAAIISSLPVKTVKIRQLQLIKGTLMADEYVKNPAAFDLYSLDEYLDLVTGFCERLSPAIMIDRISGEAPQRLLADPRNWQLRSSGILRLFEARLGSAGTWQGRLYNKR